MFRRSEHERGTVGSKWSQVESLVVVGSRVWQQTFQWTHLDLKVIGLIPHPEAVVEFDRSAAYIRCVHVQLKALAARADARRRGRKSRDYWVGYC